MQVFLLYLHPNNRPFMSCDKDAAGFKSDAKLQKDF